MTTNNAVSGALERPNPEVCARSALSTHYTSPCATIVALFDNWQAVVRTDRSPSFHPASSLAPVGNTERGKRQRTRWACWVGPVCRMRCIRGFPSSAGGGGRKRQPCQETLILLRSMSNENGRFDPCRQPTVQISRSVSYHRTAPATAKNRCRCTCLKVT